MSCLKIIWILKNAILCFYHKSQLLSLSIQIDHEIKFMALTLLQQSVIMSAWYGVAHSGTETLAAPPIKGSPTYLMVQRPAGNLHKDDDVYIIVRYWRSEIVFSMLEPFLM